MSERFNEIEIAEFTSEQISHFARHWFPARGYPNKVGPFLENIKDNSGLRDLAQSPLLLTMVCLYFEEHQDLNVSRADLYRKALETILERWDATRDIKREDSPYGRLSTSARESLYSSIARRHFEKGEIVFPVPDVKEFFSEPAEPSAILRVMEAQHGLLIQRAQGIYSFSHLTFQEYLTAKHFVEDSDPGRWNRLLPHLPDLRWREVFLLVTSMVSADYLPQQMQTWLNNLVSARPAIQELLRWVQRKQEASQGVYKPAAVRFLYLFIGQVATRRSGGGFYDLDCALDRARALDRTLDRDLDRALDHIFALVVFDRTRALALALNEAFLRDLEKLRKLAWDKKVDKSWIKGLQQAIIKYRDVGYDFRLGKSDFEHLTQYENGHRVLIDCLKSERVSPAARAKIMDTLFLPSAEPPPESEVSENVDPHAQRQLVPRVTDPQGKSGRAKGGEHSFRALRASVSD